MTDHEGDDRRYYLISSDSGVLEKYSVTRGEAEVHRTFFQIRHS